MLGSVVAGDPELPLDVVRDLLGGLAVTIERREPPWRGDDVVGLLVGPGQPVRADDLERLPSLRVVATSSTGYDHVDVEAAARRGIWVCNVPGYCTEEMADSALALLLALLRGVVALDRSVREGRWDYRAAGELARIATTRVGVVGFGRIGRAFAARVRALGAEVWATDPVIPDEEIRAAGVRPAPLEELLAGCRAFSLHVPLTPETDGLIGAAELARMPAGSVLVNTARGRLVDTDAVLAALASGRLAGAALDVLPVEPPGPDAPAPQAPTLIVTPHAGWYSAESEQQLVTRPVLAVREALEGRVPRDAVPEMRTRGN